MDKLTSILALADHGLAVVDKAAELARRFDAHVDLVVTDSTQMGELAHRCAERGYENVTLSGVHRGEDSVETILVRRALERRPDLVVKEASPHPLRRWTLEPSDRWLATECPVPLLLVNDKPWTPPLRMAAAVDVSDNDSGRFARAILQSAGFLALGCRAHLDVLYSERETSDDRLRMERAVKLAQLVREFHIGTERLQMFDGAPERTLPAVLDTRQYDLLVIGAVTHRPRLDGWLETLSSKLANAAHGDLLLVKPTDRAAWGERARSSSARQQGTNLAEQLL